MRIEVLRVQVVESTNTAGGALGLALVLTAILPTALEDFLVLVLAGFFAYVSFLQWPIRRGEIKDAVGKQFGGVVDKLDAELRGELAQAVGKVRAQVTEMVAPLQEQAERDLELVEGRQRRLKVRPPSPQPSSCAVCVTRRKQHRPGVAPNANTTHVPTAGSAVCVSVYVPRWR